MTKITVGETLGSITKLKSCTQYIFFGRSCHHTVDIVTPDDGIICQIDFVKLPSVSPIVIVNP
jgi:hypothetical protein